MAEKVLNLDKFILEPRFVEMGGQRYEVLPVCVETFLGVSDKLEQLQSAQEAKNLAETVGSALDVLHALVPELPMEKAKRLPMDGLLELVQFATESMAGDAEPEAGEAEPAAP